MEQPWMRRPPKLLPNQVLITDEQNGLEYIYDISDEEELDFIQRKGKIDENGNLTLSKPIICALTKWSPSIGLNRIEEQVRAMRVPTVQMPEETVDGVGLPNLHNVSNKQLEELLSMFAGWRSYLEAQLGKIEAKRSVLQATFDESIAKAMYAATINNQSEKRLTKEVLRAQVLMENVQLKEMRKQLIETDGLFIQMSGIRDAYKSAYEAVSRVVALRLATREEN